MDTCNALGCFMMQQHLPRARHASACGPVVTPWSECMLVLWLSSDHYGFQTRQDVVRTTVVESETLEVLQQ